MSGLKGSVLNACRRILAPLTRILIRFGVSAGELNALIEQEYVRSAVRQLAERDELVTASRIAVITGLPRNVVASIVASLGEESPRRVGSLVQRAQRVLTGWHEDREFQDRDGDAAVLPMSGSARSFEALVERYVGGGVRASTVLKELQATGAVRLTRDNQVRALRRSAAAGGADPGTVQQLGEVTAALLSAFEQNLLHGPEEQLAIRGVTREASPADVPIFRTQMGRRADAFAEVSEAFFDGRVAERAAQPARDPDAVLLGSFVFTSFHPVREPVPRWQKGLAARLKDGAPESDD